MSKIDRFIEYIFQDWQVNSSTSFKSRLVLVLFRSVHALRNLPGYLSWIFWIDRGFYQISVEWILGIELPWDTQVGPGLQLQHGRGLVVNFQTVIGDDCVLRNTTTIGNKKLRDGTYSQAPRIGNRVDIGAHAVIIGAVTIGDDAVIGAGAVVVKDVPARAVVAGNPAKVIRMIEPTNLTGVEGTTPATSAPMAFSLIEK